MVTIQIRFLLLISGAEPKPSPRSPADMKWFADGLESNANVEGIVIELSLPSLKA